VELDSEALLEGYGRLAAACLTTCFLLSQRDAACRRLRDSGHEELCAELLPALAEGQSFATVGLAQLTTSRQHVRPVLTARPHGNGLVLDGVMPWVTGAPRAEHFVTGAVLEDGRQVLLVVPRQAEGLTVGEPLPLMALQGSLTATISCREVFVPPRYVLAGPAERVMVSGRSGTGGLETSCLALGLARAALDHLAREAQRRPEWQGPAERLESVHGKLRASLFEAARGGCTAETATRLRAQSNALVLRAAQAALAASKGTGFLRTHPAQRWVRQAHFFLVWSCPRPAVDATLEALLPPASFLSEPGN
jgi:alkylation response protein AidB-like acyl-CoA dehydrogenase